MKPMWELESEILATLRANAITRAQNYVEHVETLMQELIKAKLRLANLEAEVAQRKVDEELLADLRALLAKHQYWPVG